MARKRTGKSRDSKGGRYRGVGREGRPKTSNAPTSDLMGRSSGIPLQITLVLFLLICIAATLRFVLLGNPFQNSDNVEVAARIIAFPGYLWMIYENYGFGLKLVNSSNDNWIANNTFEENNLLAINIKASSNLVENSVIRNSTVGIELSNLDGNLVEKNYVLKPEFKYRAGSEFDEFLKEYRVREPLKVKYYLLQRDILNNSGEHKLEVIDANNYNNNQYKNLVINVNDRLNEEIKSNILYVRTVDTGSNNGRVGLELITEDFNVDGIYVSGNTYRTHPIQIFFEPTITLDEQNLLRDYFNFTFIWDSIHGRMIIILQPCFIYALIYLLYQKISVRETTIIFME